MICPVLALSNLLGNSPSGEAKKNEGSVERTIWNRTNLGLRCANRGGEIVSEESFLFQLKKNNVNVVSPIGVLLSGSVVTGRGSLASDPSLLIYYFHFLSWIVS